MCQRLPFELKEIAQQRDELRADQRDAASSHELFNPLALY